jgi:hypothetical protein
VWSVENRRFGVKRNLHIQGRRLTKREISMKQVPGSAWLAFNGLHDVTSHKIKTFRTIAERTSNAIYTFVVISILSFFISAADFQVISKRLPNQNVVFISYFTISTTYAFPVFSTSAILVCQSVILILYLSFLLHSYTLHTQNIQFLMQPQFFFWFLLYHDMNKSAYRKEQII